MVRFLKHLYVDRDTGAFLKVLKVDLEKFEVVKQVAYFFVHNSFFSA